MPSEEITIYLNVEEVELFKKFRQFQTKWERLFAKGFVGSLTIHSGGTTEDGGRMIWEWIIRER